MEETRHESQVDLAALVELARTIEGRDELAQAICALAVADLGLSGASISVVSDSSGQPRLDSIAAVGQLSSFTLDISTPLDRLTDATHTALRGEPIFVGNPHGVSHEAQKSTGIGRWREGFGSHAHATLGLTSQSGTFGVLILEWAEPKPFPEAERDSLQLFASVAALALHAVSNGQPAPQSEQSAVPQPVDVTALQVNARGLVVPEAVARAWREPPALRVWTAATPEDASPDSVALAQVTGMADGGVMITTGAVHAKSDGIAVLARDAGLGVVGAAAAHGSPPSEVLGMLGSAVRAHSAWATGLAVALWPESGALEVAEAGAAAMLTLGPGGRLDIAVSSAPPVGTSSAAAPTRMQLALPGDRIALLSSDRVATFADAGHVAKAKQLLASLPLHGGEQTARSLLELMSKQGGDASVTLIEVVIGG